MRAIKGAEGPSLPPVLDPLRMDDRLAVMGSSTRVL